MLGQRRRRWPNIKPTLVQNILFSSGADADTDDVIWSSTTCYVLWYLITKSNIVDQIQKNKSDGTKVAS